MIDLSCTVSGLMLSGEKSEKTFTETIHVEHSVTGEGWGISKSEVVSDGVRIEPTLVDATSAYAVLAHVTSIGKGYGRKLLIFTLIVDFDSLEITRIVSSVPAGSEERTSFQCKRI